MNVAIARQSGALDNSPATIAMASQVESSSNSVWEGKNSATEHAIHTCMQSSNQLTNCTNNAYIIPVATGTV